ncbi:hypothetical protein IWQ62_000907 [Dispira parvispora]|uniref:Uncharacterized protein n=1 Tax=Dispira parvispora TaxID=1520584 RepID=A0A9W8B0A8_9FUNG|nr:hypothetical protein IWQ62_000907 [Dispira parvispora]
MHPTPSGLSWGTSPPTQKTATHPFGMTRFPTANVTPEKPPTSFDHRLVGSASQSPFGASPPVVPRRQPCTLVSSPTPKTRIALPSQHRPQSSSFIAPQRINREIPTSNQGVSVGTGRDRKPVGKTGRPLLLSPGSRSGSQSIRNRSLPHGFSPSVATLSSTLGGRVQQRREAHIPKDYVHHPGRRGCPPPAVESTVTTMGNQASGSPHTRRVDDGSMDGASMYNGAFVVTDPHLSQSPLRRLSKPTLTLSSMSLHHATPVIASARSPLLGGTVPPALVPVTKNDRRQVNQQSRSRRMSEMAPWTPGEPAHSPTSPPLFSSSLAALNQSLANLTVGGPNPSTAVLSPSLWPAPLDQLVTPSRRSSLLGNWGPSNPHTIRDPESAHLRSLQDKVHQVARSLPHWLAVVPHYHSQALESVYQSVHTVVPRVVASKKVVRSTKHKVALAESDVRDSLVTVRALRSLDQINNINSLLYRALHTLETIKGHRSQ